MSEDQGLGLVYALMCVVLVASGLASSRIPLGKAAKMAVAWVAIFAGAFGLFAFRNEFSAVGGRLKSELLGTPMEQGGELRISMNEDGHFWTTAEVNGKSVRFLVDSGATTTTIGRDEADDIGLIAERGRIPVDTANGTVGMTPTTGSLRLGPIERPDMRLLINEGDTDNVLGMNFLSSLSSWRVEGRELVLRP